MHLHAFIKFVVVYFTRVRFGLLIILIVSIFSNGKCQDTLHIDWAFHKVTSLVGGYNYNVEDSDEKKYHLIELGIWNSKFGGRHPSVLCWNYGVEFGLNTSKFLIGPKFGGFFGYGLFLLGSEINIYTDFEEVTLRYCPYFGIGYYQFKLTLNPQIGIINKEFDPINTFQVNLTIRIFDMKKNRLNNITSRNNGGCCATSKMASSDRRSVQYPNQ